MNEGYSSLRRPISVVKLRVINKNGIDLLRILLYGDTTPLTLQCGCFLREHEFSNKFTHRPCQDRLLLVGEGGGLTDSVCQTEARLLSI